MQTHLRHYPAPRARHTLDKTGLPTLLPDAILPAVSKRKDAAIPNAPDQFDMLIREFHRSLLNAKPATSEGDGPLNGADCGSRTHLDGLEGRYLASKKPANTQVIGKVDGMRPIPGISRIWIKREPASG